MIEKFIFIEELIDEFPPAVDYLRKKGIKCLACGEPIWGTLEEACKEKNFSSYEIENIVLELNNLANKK